MPGGGRSGGEQSMGLRGLSGAIEMSQTSFMVMVVRLGKYTKSIIKLCT